MNDETQAKMAEMLGVGITVKPSRIGGFSVYGLKNIDSCWATTEQQAWALAYGLYKAVMPND